MCNKSLTSIYLCNQCLSPLSLWVWFPHMIQQYVIKFLNDLCQIGGFWVLGFPPQTKRATTMKLMYLNISSILKGIWKFLIMFIFIKSPKQSLGDLLFLLHFLLSLPNKIVFAPFLIIIINIILLFLLFLLSFRGPWTISTADLRNYWTEFHETWWNYRYMFLVGRKVFSFVVKGVKVIFWEVQRGWGLL